MFKRSHPREIGKKVAMRASNTCHQETKEKNERQNNGVGRRPFIEWLAKHIFMSSFKSIT